MDRNADGALNALLAVGGAMATKPRDPRSELTSRIEAVRTPAQARALLPVLRAWFKVHPGWGPAHLDGDRGPPAARDL